MIFCTLDASFSGNMVTGKDVILVGEGTLRPGKMMPPPHLTNFEVQKTSKLKSIIWGFFKKNSLLQKIKDRVYVISMKLIILKLFGLLFMLKVIMHHILIFCCKPYSKKD